jgi:hypothetical protein
MKINEIIFDEKKELFDRILNNDITDNVKKLFKHIEYNTNGFAELSHEKYSPEDLADLIDKIEELKSIVFELFPKSSQTYKIIEWLVYYLKS